MNFTLLLAEFCVLLKNIIEFFSGARFSDLKSICLLDLFISFVRVGPEQIVGLI